MTNVQKLPLKNHVFIILSCHHYMAADVNTHLIIELNRHLLLIHDTQRQTEQAQ